MNANSSQITGVSVVYSTVCSGVDQKKNQSTASLSFEFEFPAHRAITRKIFLFDDVIMEMYHPWHRNYLDHSSQIIKEIYFSGIRFVCVDRRTDVSFGLSTRHGSCHCVGFIGDCNDPDHQQCGLGNLVTSYCGINGRSEYIPIWQSPIWTCPNGSQKLFCFFSIWSA